jgi:hypothetical protein
VERALYEDGRPVGGDRFFLRVLIHNRGERPILVDLRDHWKAFYPNQWGRDDRERRLVIDERRLTVAPLDAAARDALLKLAPAPGVLGPLPAGQEADYYIAFHGVRGPDLDGPGAFLLVSLDGQLPLTDGTKAERLTLPEDAASRDLVLPGRVQWKRIPTGARVLGAD